MKKARFAVIGGTGLEEAFPEGRRMRVGTPYGPSAPIILASVASKEVVFLARHGEKHSVPPHKINYRANIWALHNLGVERILASNAVGGVNPKLKPGDFLIPSDFIDFTHSRPSTFYDEAPVTHVDASSVYCPELREVLSKATSIEKVKALESGVYLCTNGPRYESPAEIRGFRSLGCDVVGMTGLPEAVLAHELGLCYTSLCYVTNMAAGMAGKVIAEEVDARGRHMGESIKRIILTALETIPKKRSCNCSESLEGARV